jgi:hypothetical protein
MRCLSATLLLIFCAAPAMAMNWEGHDDWMQDMSHAQVYEHALPHARPLPDRDCPEATTARSDNPYEQIPLRPGHCDIAREGANPTR